MSVLISFAHSRLSWLLLTVSAGSLLLIAVYFQYGMQLEPCVLCIYQRLAVLGLLLAGVIGLIAPQFRPVRLLATTVWAISSIWGGKLALELVELQSNANPFATCPFLPDFPNWFAVHQWLPQLFMPTGMCTDLPWEFAGVTMAQWMMVIFIGYFATLLLFIVPLMKK